MRLCECGCGKEVVKEGNRFIHGHNWQGRCHTKETLQKQREVKLGEKNPMYGKPSWMTGKQHSEEVKNKMSEAQKRRFSRSDHPMLGRKHSEATKRHWSEIRKGRCHTEETKRKIREAFQRNISLNMGWTKASPCKKGHWVRSTWELVVADWLFSNGVEYEYEPERFVFNRRWSYLPDFYIPSVDLYIEVKGQMDSKSKLQHILFEGLGYTLLVVDDVSNLDKTLSFLQGGD